MSVNDGAPSVECLRVLTVDDDAAIHQLLHALLDGAETALKIFSASSLGEAIRCLEEHQIDVVLLDLNLPDSAGPKTVSAVCNAAPAVPIVVLTCLDDREIAVEALKAGAQEYLVKGGFQNLALMRTLQYAVERKRAEDAEHARRSMQHSVQSMEQVIGVVAHELRTPLAALRATTEFLLTAEARELDEWDVFLRSLHDEVVRMSQMLNNLLEAARIRSGCAKWKWTTVCVRDACDEAVQLVRHMIDPGKPELNIDVQPADMRINGDYDAICRLVTNLLNNAARHTFEGSITVTARPIDSEPEPHIEIVISDTGEGIAPEMVERLGEAFALNRGAIGSDFVPGAGLGLSICAGIVATHGGTIAVSSTPGAGTTFRILLRSDLPEPAETATPAPIQQELAA